MNDDHIPPLLSVDEMPAICSQDDLHRHWRVLMGPLGFSGRQLWLHVIGADRRPTPMLLQVDEAPEDPEPAMLDGLMAVLGEMLAEAPGGSVALLLARPGCLATDEEVRAFAPDDLAA